MAKATRPAPSKSAADPAVQVSIPNPVRDTPAPSAKSALDKLAALGGTKKAKASSKKPEHPRLPLTPEAKEKVRVWIPAKILFDHFEEYKKQAEKEMDKLIKDLFYQGWWANKSFPANPTLDIEDDNGRADMTAMFVFQERFRVEIPEGDDPEQAMIDLIVSVDLSKDNATRLVKNELVIDDEKTINLTTLLRGKKVGQQWVNPSPIEQSAASKLIAFLNGESVEPLNVGEIHAAILTTEYRCTVKPGFLERAHTYCDQTKTDYGQLKGMMELIFHPVVAHRGAKYGISDAMETKNQRIIGEAATILGVALGVDSDGDDD